jgi:hypothetical protein
MSIYDTLDASSIKKSGAFYLSDVRLVSYRSKEGDNEADSIGIETMVVDMNIYESIFNKTLSGNLLIVDANNIIGKLPLTGNERLEFKFFTPSLSKGYDFTSKSGNPMYVYKIQNRTDISPRAQTYLLHFCSKEMMTNELVVVSNAQTESYSNMVANITRNEDFLGSVKDFYFEPSWGLHKHIFPRVRPFDAIDTLSAQTRSTKFEGAGYYFYETSSGFNFRSLESMMAIEGNTARPALARFRPKPANVNQGGEKDIKNEMQIAIKYRIVDQFDTLKNLRNGVFASKLITHDQLNKTYEETDFSYHAEYENLFHVEAGKDGVRTNNQGILPYYIREGQTLSDYPESTLYLWSQTSDTHYSGDTPLSNPDMTQILQKRLSQRLALHSFKLELTVPGMTGLQAGDIINFDMPSYEPAGGSEPLDHDPYLSGRYLVTSIRHQLNRKQNKHFMVLECMKDSVNRPYPEEGIDTFINKEKAHDGIVDIYEIDKMVADSSSGIFS